MLVLSTPWLCIQLAQLKVTAIFWPMALPKDSCWNQSHTNNPELSNVLHLQVLENVRSWCRVAPTETPKVTALSVSPLLLDDF